jgi:hypothetical protein
MAEPFPAGRSRKQRLAGFNYEFTMLVRVFLSSDVGQDDVLAH